MQGTIRTLALTACLAVGTVAAQNGSGIPADTSATTRAPANSTSDSRVMPPDASVEGVSFGELTAEWWRWTYSLPIAPYNDPDGRFCDLAQHGPVWFLAGTDGSFNPRRECTVPAGKYLLLPVINMLHLNPARASSRRDCGTLQAAAAVNNDHLNSAVVLIDGVPVPDVSHYRIRSDGCFTIGSGGRGDDSNDMARLAAADGYWLLIKPLPPGRHTISVGANYGAGDRAYGKMVQSFEYVLHVGGRVSTTSVEDRPRQPVGKAARSRDVLGAMGTLYQRGRIQEENLYYAHKKRDGRLPLIGANTFLPRDHAGDIVTGIEPIRSTGTGKGQQIGNVRNFQQLRNGLATSSGAPRRRGISRDRRRRPRLPPIRRPRVPECV